jgi:hypothetical protein
MLVLFLDGMSIDPIISVNQISGAYWKRIKTEFINPRSLTKSRARGAHEEKSSGHVKPAENHRTRR